MLPRTKKVGKQHFPSPAAPGRVFATPLFSCKVSWVADRDTPARFAVVVSKKVAKSAVARNTLRRRVFAAVRETGGTELAGFVGVFYMRNPATEAPYKEIAVAIKGVFDKLPRTHHA